MQNALVFVLRTLFDLYLLTFALRLILQWSRVDSWNPLLQFIFRITNPLVVPLRRLLPPIGRIDTATLTALLGLQVIGTVALIRIACIGDAGAGQILFIAILSVARIVLRIYFWAILIHVILSWVSPGGYNPVAAMVAALVEPVLAPFRRLIPLIGGLDLSPVFVIIAIQALIMLLPLENLFSGLLCTGVARPLF